MVESPAVPTPEGAHSDSESEPGGSRSAGDADLSGDEEESPRGGLGAGETSAGADHIVQDFPYIICISYLTPMRWDRVANL